MLAAGGAKENPPLNVIEADLMADASWREAVSGCEYVLHVASPFPASQPKDENELVAPARDGTLRVLRAARDAGVRRVVLTSSFAAIGYGREHPGRAYTEDDWTEIDAPNAPYIRSKTIAERSAWEFMAADGGDMELCVINPTGIFGPVLGSDHSTSIGMVKALLEGVLPGPPDMNFGVVDVRDVADLHLLAMTDARASGQRFLAVSGKAMTLAEVAQVLHDRFGSSADRIPAHALLQNQMAGDHPLKRRNASNQKARELLGWSPIPPEDAIAATAESMIRLRLLTKARNG